MFEDLKTPVNTEAKKGLDLMDIKVFELRRCLSKIDVAFLCDLVFDKYGDYTNYLFDCFVGNKVYIPVDYVYELNDILYKHSQDTKNISSSDHALDIIDKLDVLINQYCIREAESAEHEKEMKDLPAVKQGYKPERKPRSGKYIIRYFVNVYYEDGHSSYCPFIGCADGLVFNFRQNNLNLDAPERGLRSVFNMFNFPEPEKIVACDLSYELVEDIPF